MHQSSSHIGYYFIDAELISKVLIIKYHPIVHHLSLDIQISPQPGTQHHGGLILCFCQKENAVILL